MTEELARIKKYMGNLKALGQGAAEEQARLKVSCEMSFAVVGRRLVQTSLNNYGSGTQRRTSLSLILCVLLACLICCVVLNPDMKIKQSSWPPALARDHARRAGQPQRMPETRSD